MGDGAGKGGVAPDRLRLGLPVLTAANIALLACAHLLHGASTEVNGHAPLGALKPHTASDDNLVSAVQRLANAGAWCMVFIVAIMSGLWPYLKLLTTLITVGLVDTGSMSKDLAAWVFTILEIGGKYCFADIFLIIIDIMILDISTGGSYTIMAFGKLSIELFMSIKFAPLALLMAVVHSTLLTKWAAIELAPVKEAPSENEEEIPLLRGDTGTLEDQKQAAPPKQAGRSLLLSLCLYAVMVAGVVCLVVGAWMPVVTVERGGFLGNLIRPKEDRTLHISVFSVVPMLWGQTEGVFYTRFFAIVFILSTFVLPLLELLAIGATAAANKCLPQWSPRFRLAGEWFHSFDCVDVFLIVVLVTIFEIKTVVEFNIGDECAPFESIMNNKALLTVAGLGFAASDTCFDPVARLEAGLFYLVAVIVFRQAAWALLPAAR